MTASSPRTPPQALQQIDTSSLESLVGYNARRASMFVVDIIREHIASYDLRIVDLSILLLVAHNPGITSRQLSSVLDILPPNLVGMLNMIEKRGLIERKPHPVDGRAMGLHATDSGSELAAQTESEVGQLEIEATSHLTATERKTLIRLLQKIYRR
ncbi:MAG: MarR family winged helix-turn-helix transcriptional regulator [Burkholderiales bacterium]|nr:MarR family winged helix-turn-helix transcriptional regulator [Burkholderiales bacterium]